MVMTPDRTMQGRLDQRLTERVRQLEQGLTEAQIAQTAADAAELEQLGLPEFRLSPRIPHSRCAGRIARGWDRVPAFADRQDDAAAGGQQRRRGVGAVAAGPVLEQQPPVMHPLDRCHQFSQNPGDVLLPTRATREG